MSGINERIIPLDEMDDFEVAEGDPDVRGWQVCGADGGRNGEVDELLVDTEALKVRYLDVGLDDSPPSQDRHILIPIGYARLHESDDRIVVDELDGERLAQLPPYAQEPLTRDFENALLLTFRGAAHAPAGQHIDPYAGQAFDDSGLYGPRRNAAAKG